VRNGLGQLLARYGQLEQHEGPIEMGHFVTVTLRTSYEGRQLSAAHRETIEIKPTLSFTRCTAGRLRQAPDRPSGRRDAHDEARISPDAEKRRIPRKEVDLSLEIVTVEHRKLPELTANSSNASAASLTRPS